MTMDSELSRYYYYIKPFLSRRLQILIRSAVANRKRTRHLGTWPIDRSAGTPPKGWQQWPDRKQFALVLTHDVDTFQGHELSRALMQLEMNLGFRSSFNFVAASYPVSPELRRELADNGFEVGIHGLEHSRELYESREAFLKHAVKINRYLEEWGAVGFRSPSMYHNLEWLGDLNIKYDASTFDTDPFEPQPDGVGTIFPFFVPRRGGGRDYLELPYTLPQDFTLFILLGEKGIGLWKEKLRWIAEQGGMVLLNTHPDYMKFSGISSYAEYPSGFYEEFLQHVASEYAGCYWHALPRAVVDFMELQREVKAPAAFPIGCSSPIHTQGLASA